MDSNSTLVTAPHSSSWKGERCCVKGDHSAMGTYNDNHSESDHYIAYPALPKPRLRTDSQIGVFPEHENKQRPVSSSLQEGDLFYDSLVVSGAKSRPRNPWAAVGSVTLLSLVLLVSLELEQSREWRNWLIFGLLSGVGALANPTTLAFLPFCGLWIWRQRHRRGLSSLSGIAVSSAIFFLVVTPWLVRNYEVFGRFVFLRDDFGLQFRLGNGDGADGMSRVYLQPNLNKLEFEKFQRRGELAYAADCKRSAFDWVRAHPRRFLVISLKRVFYYWNGVPKPTDSTAFWDFRSSLFLASSVLAIWGLILALRQKRCGAWLFAGLIVTYPAVYYVVYPHARYRHPIEPELVILAVFLLSQAKDRTRNLAAPVESKA